MESKDYDWHSCANRHLLAHIVRQASKKIFYCHPSDSHGCTVHTAHPFTLELTNILRAHAHCWALDMADWPNGPPSASEQRAAWEKAMQEAEKEVKIVRGRHPVNEFTPE